MVQLAVYNAFLIYKAIASGLPMSRHKFSEVMGIFFVQFFFLLDVKILIQTEKNVWKRELLREGIKGNKHFKKF